MTSHPRTLRDFTGPSRASGNQLCYKNCPVCGSQSWKLYVNPQTGKWFCHAGSHGGGGCVDVGLPSDPGAALREKLRDPGKTETFWPEIEMPPFTKLSNAAQRYLVGRGFAHSLDKFWEMKDEARVLVPYFGPAGRLIYWNSRTYLPNDKGPKYKAAHGRHPLYVLPRWQPAKHVVLVEGVFDAMAVQHVVDEDTGVVALGGKSMPRYLVPDLMRLATGAITVMLDSDAQGAALKLRTQLSLFRAVTIKTLPPGTDPADTDPHELRSIIYG